MPSYTSLITVALSALTLSSARPLVARNRREYCSPNFEGANVSIVQQEKEWEARSNSAGAEVFFPAASKTGVNAPDWRLEQTGQGKTDSQTGRFKATYIIKDVTDTSNSLIIAARDGKLKLETLTWNNDAAQTWEVNCYTCKEGISGIKGSAASSCHIIDSTNGRCVQSGSESLELAPCNGSPNQQWDFFTQNDGGNNFDGGEDGGDDKGGDDDGEDGGDDGGDDAGADDGQDGGEDDAGADDGQDGGEDNGAGGDDGAGDDAGDDGADDAGDDGADGAGDKAGDDGADDAGGDGADGAGDKAGDDGADDKAGDDGADDAGDKAGDDAAGDDAGQDDGEDGDDDAQDDAAADAGEGDDADDGAGQQGQTQ